MDIKRLNCVKYKIMFFLIPLAILISACINFVFFMVRILPVSTFIFFVTFHLLLLISLSAVCGNATIEIVLTLFEDREKSSLRRLIYGGRSFLPVKNIIFVFAFIVGYIMLMRTLQYSDSLFILILVIPPFGILFNAPRFLSGRVRLINGVYLFYKKGFNVIFSYYTDERGALIFVTDEGKTVNTGVITTDIDFKALEPEFKKNHLAVSMTRTAS